MNAKCEPAMVVLVHGLWLNGQEMSLLGRRLRRAGFAVKRFSYPSRRGDLREQGNRLSRFVRCLATETVHLVAHSYGGLVVLRALEDIRPVPPGRIVALGSPFAGSAVARRLARKGVGRWLLGQSRNALEDGLSVKWGGGRELGVVAGTLDLGAGRLLGRLPKPNDGTVVAAETRLAGDYQHILLPVSHTGLLLSKDVARHVCCFLNNGTFCGTE